MAEKQFFDKREQIEMQIESGLKSVYDDVYKLKNDAEKFHILQTAHFSSLMSMNNLLLSKEEESRKNAEDAKLQSELIVDGLNSLIPKLSSLVNLFVVLNNHLVFTKGLVATTAVFQLIMVITINILMTALGYVTGFSHDIIFKCIDIGLGILSLLYPLILIYFIKYSKKNTLKLNDKKDEKGDNNVKSDS